MELKWHGFMTFIIIPVFAQSREKSDGKFWNHLRTTHKPLFGVPDIAEWYQDNDEESYDNNYYNFYNENSDEASFQEDNQVVKSGNEGAATSNAEFGKSGAIQNDSPFGFGDIPEKTSAESYEGPHYSYNAALNQESGLFGYQSNNIHQLDIERCSDEPNIKYYCRRLQNGLYFDPWNPWCGFIKCLGQTATRHCCAEGTWMGLGTAIKYAGKKMCRQRLPKNFAVSEEDACPAPTDYDLCKNAKVVELEQDTQKK